MIAFWGGLFHWLWLAYQLGSWWMLLMTMFPPTTVLAVGVGIWSVPFGVPVWVLSTFG